MSSYAVRWYPFTEHPEADSCWSLSTGPDGRAYIASCAEGLPGNTVRLVRYNEKTEGLDWLLDLDQAVDDPRDNGRATQCKIHYSFAPSQHDGVMYMATHLSGPPIDQPAYSPWKSWHDPERCFRGSALLAYDTRADKVLWWDTLIPKEGCRCLAHDEERRTLYAIGYPRDHFIVYDLDKRKARDLGRIGSVNAQAIFIDRKHRAWTSDDYGHLVRYDPATDRLERSPWVLPHNPLYQTGWHSVIYDVCASPEGDCVYMVAWNGDPYLIRFWPEDGPWGRVESLGPVNPVRDPASPENFFYSHCGGLVFGGDGCLYYVGSRSRSSNKISEEKDLEGVLWRLDPKTLQKDEVAVLMRPDGVRSQYVSRGAVDRNGELFFGHCAAGPRPVGMFRVTPPADRRKPNSHLPLRMWG